MLKHVLVKTGTPHSEHKVVPFVGEIIPDISPEGPVVCFGSYSLRRVAKAKNWAPGVWDLERHTYERCIQMWGREMLNFDSILTTIAGIPMYVKDNEEWFARPDGDNKNFAGGVKSSNDLYEILRCVKNLEPGEAWYGMSLDMPIILSRVREIYSEYRNWIVDGEVVTSSQYKQGAKVIYRDDVDEEVKSYVRRMVDIWQPERAFVIDVAKTADGMKIVEINTLNAAGFYAADTYRLFEAIERMGY